MKKLLGILVLGLLWCSNVYAAKEHTYLLIFGLLLSVFLIATAATFFAEYIKQHSWVGLVGLLVIFVVALQLIAGGMEAQYPGFIPEPFKSWL